MKLHLSAFAAFVPTSLLPALPSMSLVVALAALEACGGSSAAPPATAASPAAAAPAAAPAAAKTTSAVPPRVKGQNPFAGVKLYVNNYSNAAQQAQDWESSRPADAKLIAKIAAQPTAWWMGEWSKDVQIAAKNLGNATSSEGTVPLVVLYNVPNRDCGQYSKGGSVSNEAYSKWIREFAKGAGSNRFIVVLEPDALGLMTKCLSPADQKARMAMMKDAVEVLEATPGVSVYIDAGNAKWAPAADMAKRLQGAGIDEADGFALNVSNYIANEPTIEYGHAISALLGGKHFIVDTGRNGNGATADAEWCNPDGRAIGVAPTTNTGDPLVDAFMWVKPPGESDGTCHGGPKAGDFWPELALGLAKRAKW
ncbi:MAG TPA: glycoside hydrolase family 6 protein [Polyangiaceae bacterium]|jgi:endoglucanase|nr:glycoside hydrolase family 6 protein [Polyangiaceae bacterium]